MGGAVGDDGGARDGHDVLSASLAVSGDPPCDALKGLQSLLSRLRPDGTLAPKKPPPPRALTSAGFPLDPVLVSGLKDLIAERKEAKAEGRDAAQPRPKTAQTAPTARAKARDKAKARKGGAPRGARPKSTKSRAASKKRAPGPASPKP